MLEECGCRPPAAKCCRVISSQSSTFACEDLAEFEPALARFIAHGSETVAGRLALSGAPTELVQAVYGDVLRMSLKAVQAMRRGQFEYWKADMNAPAHDEAPAQGLPPQAVQE